MSTTTVEEIKKKEAITDKKSKLLLDSLEIKSYRCFEHLTIEKLGRVNLIVGKNNVGKTALLEALWIYSNKGNSEVLAEITLERNERILNKRESTGAYGFSASIYFPAYRHLFYRRPTNYKSEKEPYVGQFEIGSINNKGKKLITKLRKNQSPVIESDFRVNYLSDYNSYFIKAHKLKNAELFELWRNIELRASEELVINSLQIIANELISVRLTEYPEIDSPKIPIARIKAVSEPVPLSSLGEGMNRLFAVALALANCVNGILLIDEVEIGLHYSVFLDIWKLIFKTAQDLNIQVFATTHSWDCIEAFTQAAIEDKEAEGMLIRLENKNDKIKATTFSEKELEAVTRRNIEVR
ncbi:MAG TPA: AAA family ATPase [Pyrinomonadaceae bacterium]|jgi:AAA15 family ATPase/GTPase